VDVKRDRGDSINATGKPRARERMHKNPAIRLISRACQRRYNGKSRDGRFKSSETQTLQSSMNSIIGSRKNPVHEKRAGAKSCRDTTGQMGPSCDTRMSMGHWEDMQKGTFTHSSIGGGGGGGGLV